MSPGGYNRIVIFTDAFTKLSVFVRCKSTLTAEGLANLYLEHVWKVYGRPGKLVSDNEPILCAEAWLKVHEILGTKLTHVAAYNAKANSPAENMVKQLKAMLRAYEVQGLKWWKVLAACERSYNDSVHSTTGFTPFYMNFGRHPFQHAGTQLEPHEEQFVSDFITEYVNHTQAELARVHDLALERMHEKFIKTTAARNAHRTPTFAYQIGDYVYLESSSIKKSHSLAPLRSGPYRVENITANGNALYLEGFKHPFNVEIIVPALCYKDGTNPHLTQHDLSKEVVGPVAMHLEEQEVLDTDKVVDSDSQQEVIDLAYEHSAEGNAQLQDQLEDLEGVWGREPLIRIVPSSEKALKPGHIVRVPMGDLDSELGLLNKEQEVIDPALDSISNGAPTNTLPLSDKSGPTNPIAETAIPSTLPKKSQPIVRFV